MTRLEKTANVVIILTCVLVAGNVVRNYYLSRNLQLRMTQGIPKGTVVKLTEAIPGNRQPAVPSLVLVLSKNCRYCQESVGFYKKLSAFKNSSLQELRLVAVLPHSKEEAESYLKEQGIVVDEVVSMPLSQLGAKATPTLLLLNPQNQLEESWVGKLSESQESQLIARLKKICGGCLLPSS